MKILYVDGFNFFYRGLNKDKLSQDKKGEPMGGTVSFFRQLFFTMNTLMPNKVVICWDGDSAGERRRKLYSGYKSKRGRHKVKTYDMGYQNISNEDTQYIEILTILEYLPVEIYKVDYLEADDLIQYFVAKNKGEGVIQYIASTDQDYLQCVEKDVYVWNPETKLLMDGRKIEEKFGFMSDNFIWYKIIKGDDSDEIPGVNGIALKTMLKIFPEIQQQKIDSLQDLLYLIENKEGKGVALQNLKNSAGLLTRNYQLMRLSESNINYKRIEEIENQNQMQSEIKFEPGLLDIHLIRKGFYIYFKDFSYIKKIFLLIDTKQKLKV